MSLREIVAQAFEAAGGREGLVLVFAENVTIVGGETRRVDLETLQRDVEEARKAIVVLQDKQSFDFVDQAAGANPEIVDQMMDDDKNWEMPGAAEKLLAEIYAIKGNLTQEKLREFALAKGFTKAAADRLWGTMFHDEDFNGFVADRGAPLQKGKDGESLLMKSVRKVAALEDLVPGCVRGFGECQYELLLTVVAPR